MMKQKQRDFTLYKAAELYHSFIDSGYRPSTLYKHVLENNNSDQKIFIIRHDVDRFIDSALHMAGMEADMGISASYYFRTTKNVFKKRIIKKIAEMGHEIGYHYEVLSQSKGDMVKAISLFEQELEKLRAIAEVNTICMHGSPLSRWDSRKIWEMFDYREYGIIAEPYFDIDYEKVLYLTDTGRRWDGNKFNIRDHVNSSQSLSFKETNDIICSLNKKILPNTVLLNMHPNRWVNSMFLWIYELLAQNAKNTIKRRFFVKQN